MGSHTHFLPATRRPFGVRHRWPAGRGRTIPSHASAGRGRRLRPFPAKAAIPTRPAPVWNARTAGPMIHSAAAERHGPSPFPPVPHANLVRRPGRRRLGHGHRPAAGPGPAPPRRPVERREENARILRERRENVRLLPGVPIPDSVELTTDIAHATAGADLWVAAVPTVYLRATLLRERPRAPAGAAGAEPGQGPGERDVPAADGDPDGGAGRGPNGGAERAEPRRGGQPRPADVGGRRQPRHATWRSGCRRTSAPTASASTPTPIRSASSWPGR